MDDVPEGRDDEVTRRTSPPPVTRRPARPPTGCGSWAQSRPARSPPNCRWSHRSRTRRRTSRRHPSRRRRPGASIRMRASTASASRWCGSPTSPVTRSAPGPASDRWHPGQTAVPARHALPTELPHWTEPPTGQVPAVLPRDAGDEGEGRASRRPPGARRMPTGWPTTTSSIRPCSAAIRWRWARSTNPTAPIPSAGRGSSIWTRRSRGRRARRGAPSPTPTRCRRGHDHRPHHRGDRGGDAQAAAPETLPPRPKPSRRSGARRVAGQPPAGARAACAGFGAWAWPPATASGLGTPGGDVDR